MVGTGPHLKYVLITLIALVVSGLTLFSGFGLGTVLMPAFAVFFPVPTAIAAADDIFFQRLDVFWSCGK